MRQNQKMTSPLIYARLLSLLVVKRQSVQSSIQDTLDALGFARNDL
jgi:hypothetical protein